MKKIRKDLLSTYSYYIPSFLFERNTNVFQNKKHIYGINKVKKAILICNANFTNRMFIPFSELKKINILLGEKKQWKL